MLKRILKIVFSAAAITLTPALASISAADAQRTADFIKLYTVQPVGFRGQLVTTGFTIGKVLHTADGGQVFGFDVNQRGNDGLLGSAKDVGTQGHVQASVETFNQTTAKITKVIVSTRTMDDWVTAGIVGNDVGLILHEHVVNNHNFRSFRTINPVTSQMFTGVWTPPNGANFLLQQVAENQATRKSAILGSDLMDNPIVFSSDVAANTLGPVFHLDPNHFGGADSPQLAQDYIHNQAVIATSPDAGAVGGSVPLIAMVNLSTGATRQFNGVRIPPFNSGYVNGLGVDSATRVACTTTELDADVEFYDLAHETPIMVAGLPGANNNQFNSGTAVVSDPIHKLFLVVQANGTIGPRGDSVIDIYNEGGTLVKSIIGFKAWSVTPGLAINPGRRMGFIQGPTPDALTQFTY